MLTSQHRNEQRRSGQRNHPSYYLSGIDGGVGEGLEQAEAAPSQSSVSASAVQSIDMKRPQSETSVEDATQQPANHDLE
jgi:hypothetical protein